MTAHRWRSHVALLSLALLSSALLIGCPGEEPPVPVTPQDMGASGEDQGSTPDLSDMRSDADIGVEDAPQDLADDLGADMADAGEMGAPPCAPYPSPAISPSAFARTLAASPARCGQPEYEWLDSERLGEVTYEGEVTRYSARTLQGLVAASGVMIDASFDYDVEVRTIGYLTQDRGELIEATAFIASPVPKGAQEGALDVLLYLHGTSGFTDGCGPSSDAETLLLSAAIASTGYVIVGPDYVGLKGAGEPTGFLHPYLVGESVAMSSLDAVRALGKLGLQDRGALCPSTDLMVLGGSQGGHAALWVDRLLPYYAPEFTLQGMVATVPPADLLGETARALSEPVQATANVAAFFGASAHWYGLGDALDEVFLSPYDQEIPEGLASSCDPSDALMLDELPALQSLFTPDLLSKRDALELDPTWGCMVAENGLTTTSIERQHQSESYGESYAILWVMGEDDALVHTPIERRSFDTLCGEGGMDQMYYIECEGASHTGATAWALPEILDFLALKRARSSDAPSGLTRCVRGEPVRCMGTPADD